MAERRVLRCRRRAGQRGQSITEFALVAPVLLFLMFGVLEMSLLLFVVGSARYASGEGAREASALGSASNTDTMAVQVIRAGPFGLSTLASVTEIDIYRLAQQANGTLTVDNTAYNRYRLDGSTIGTITWPPSARNVKQGQSDFLGLSIQFQYSWKTGRLLTQSGLSLTQTTYIRLEPQDY